MALQMQSPVDVLCYSIGLGPSSSNFLNTLEQTGWLLARNIFSRGW